MSRAFIIGAGATKAQYTNAPLNKDYFMQLYTYNPDLYHDLRQSCEILDENDFSRTNLESAISKIDTLPDSNKRMFKESLYKSLYELLGKPTLSTKAQMGDYLSNTIVPLTQTTLFRILLTDSRLSSNDFFITLNYDLYLDREILKEFRKIDYGIDPDGIIKPKYQDLSMNIINDSEYSVYHLHGALNWERLEDNKIQIHLGAVLPDVSHNDINIIIIPPDNKLIPPQFPIPIIWAKADSRIRDADELIIIGSSLNKDDVNLINLLHHFIPKREKSIKIIYNGTDQELNNYRTIWNDNLVKYYSSGFSIIKDKEINMNAIEFIFS